MKNVAIIVWKLYGGGAERIAGLLSKQISTRFNVYLFLSDVSNIVYDYKGEIIDLAVNGEEYIEDEIKKNKEKYNIDCAISFLEQSNCMNIRTKGSESVVISERCAIGEIAPYPYSDAAKIDRWYNYADCIVSVAEGVKYDLTQHFGVKEDKVVTIYNFIDKEKIYYKSGQQVDEETLKFIGKSKVILNVGRLSEQKNQKKLIVQFAKLVKENYDVKLIIIGSGREEKSLRQLVTVLKLENYVRFVTYNANPFPYYRIASVFALTSTHEGLPNVVLESLLLGVPVVATDCLSGPRELLKETSDYSQRTKGYEVCKNGILVEQATSDTTGQTAYFSEAIKKILDDNELKDILIANGKRFMESYRNEDILSQWMKVIEETESSNTEVPMVTQKIGGSKKIIVYGAGVYGRTIMKFYLSLKDELELLCFAVTDKKENPDSIYGIPVAEIRELTEHAKDAKVIIGVSDEYAPEVTKALDTYGFRYEYSCV